MKRARLAVCSVLLLTLSCSALAHAQGSDRPVAVPREELVRVPEVDAEATEAEGSLALEEEEPVAEEAPAVEPIEASPPPAEEDEATERAAQTRSVELFVGLGGGAGTLSLTIPSSGSNQHLARTVFATVALAMRLRILPERALSWEASLDYYSSVGLEVRTDPLFGLRQDVPLRVQRVELAAAPVLRLGETQRSLSMVFPLGFALRTIVPELNQFGVPDPVLAGPLLRAQLLWPLGEIAALRFGPEAQWIIVVGHTLENQGACCSGFAVGGAAWLEAEIGSAFSVAIAYRQAHTFVPNGDRSYEDIERYMTALFAGRW